jgi:hypothetical protein
VRNVAPLLGNEEIIRQRHVAIMDSGVVRQAEDYSAWKGDVALPNDFFVAEKWSDVPHWFRGK